LNNLKDDEYNFGPLKGRNEDDIVTLTYTVEPADGNSYFQIDQATGAFKITDK
jgi:hypothetical protein